MSARKTTVELQNGVIVGLELPEMFGGDLERWKAATFSHVLAVLSKRELAPDDLATFARGLGETQEFVWLALTDNPANCFLFRQLNQSLTERAAVNQSMWRRLLHSYEGGVDEVRRVCIAFLGLFAEEA